MTHPEELPDGATWRDGGVHFWVRSRHATGFELSLFSQGTEKRIAMARRGVDRHYCFVEGLGPGARYGLRAHGDYAPAKGHYFSPERLLVDPCAKAVEGSPTWRPETLGVKQGLPPLIENSRWVPKSVVVREDYPWTSPRPKRTLGELVIYEAHLQGLTKLCPDIPVELRGTYRGACQPRVVNHLRDLGVTAIEFLPLSTFLTDLRLEKLGLTNYWGYQPYAFFAPHGAYAYATEPQSQLDEFKHMVDTFHRSGIEVLVDMVFNHTGEGGRDGPHLCFRGVDNPSYYRLGPKPHEFADTTGCGNALAADNPLTHEFVLQCLRYWHHQLGVDGFRFDLAQTLRRGPNGKLGTSGLLEKISSDGQLKGCKWIAEPWDLGRDGYGLGAFDDGWLEWNDRFRDNLRDLARGEGVGAGDVLRRMSGSPEMFAAKRRRPGTSVNFVTCHDGFTLHDLSAYANKHNLANGEDNRDGEGHNRSCNFGTEGPSADLAVQQLRRGHQRQLLALLLLAKGTPMLLGGDEFSRSQQGNNNAYCQNSPLSWTEWHGPGTHHQSWIRALVRLREVLSPLPLRLFDGQGAWPALDSSERLQEALGLVWGPPARPELLLLMNPLAKPAAYQIPDLAPVEWRGLSSDCEALQSSLGALPAKQGILKPKALGVFLASRKG